MAKSSQGWVSLQSFKDRINETQDLIDALVGHVHALRTFLDWIKAKDEPDYEKFKKILEVNDKQFQKLYELGFIALFANFECFMYEYIKELFNKYPDSLKTEKTLTFDDIKDLDNISEVREHFIDSVAIEKSHSIDIWATFLSQRFGINIFKTRDDLTLFKSLNSLRNLILHSGGKTNTQFRKEMRSFISQPVPIGAHHDLDMKFFFSALLTFLQLHVLEGASMGPVFKEEATK